jgi:hypothetical protein
MKLFLANSVSYLDTYSELPHALLITGPEGVGLHTIARHLAGDDLSGEIMPTDSKGEIDNSSSGVVRISQIRALESQAMNRSRSRRVYIIDNADQMNLPAQNAFLKLLEEPSLHIRFILTSHHPDRLLTTTLSRVQTVQIPPITHDDSHEFLDTLGVHDSVKREQLLFLGDGLPAELYRLTSQTDVFEQQVAAITAARQFLQGSTAEKLTVLNQYAKDRSGSLTMLSFAERIIRFSLLTRPDTDLIERADALSEAYDRISANGHIRLQLMHLVV